MQWLFLSLREFRGSGRFTSDCISAQCVHPCDLLACLMVQPICCCQLIPMEEPYSYLQGAWQQSWRPSDRVTYTAEHAKSDSEAIHTEQVNFKGVQSYSRCMVQQLESAEYFHHCAASYDFYLEKFTMETEQENSGSQHSIVCVLATPVQGINICSFGTILVCTWLVLTAIPKPCECSPDNNYILVVQLLSHSIREPMGSVHKRRVQTDAEKNKELRAQIVYA